MVCDCVCWWGGIFFVILNKVLVVLGWMCCFIWERRLVWGDGVL